MKTLHSFFFFGGLSVHLSQALLAHLFSYNIMWGATKKEVERSNFFIEVPRILRRFWLAFVVGFLSFAMIAIFSCGILPLGWQIPGSSWAVIWPLAVVAGSHILFPIVLNPKLLYSLVNDPPENIFSVIFKSIVSRGM